MSSSTVEAPAGLDALARLTTSDSVVPLVDGGWSRYVNLDYAASTPPLEAVTQAVSTAAGLYASVHRGAGWASQVSTAAYEDARRQIAAFVGARPDDVAVVTRNTTDALTLLASAVPGAVVHLDLEHHANLLPWRTGEHRVVATGDTLEATLVALETELAARPAALLAITGASNVTGETLPLRRLADIAHRHGARLAVDGAQLVPHRPVDIAALGIDYLAFSGHKLYAPFGAGALVGRRDWLDAAPPHQPGGGAVREVTLDDVHWAQAPARHEGGTPNILGAVALGAACREITALGWTNVVDHERALADRLETGLTLLGITPLRLWSSADEVVGIADPADVVGIATFTVPGIESATVAACLSAEHGIGVRDGRFCAHPLLERLGVSGGAVRVSLGLGTTSEDVDTLLAALAAVVSSGPQWDYQRVAGVTVPVPDPRPVPTWAGGSTPGEGSPCTQ